MNIFKLIITFSIVTHTTNGVVDSKFELISSVLDNFHCHSVIFISKNTKNDINYLKRLNTYKSTGKVYFGSSLTLPMFRNANELGYNGGKKIVAVLEVNDHSFVPVLEKITKQVDISSFKWLLITQTLDVEDFENLTIPLSCDFIIAKGNSMGFTLTEVYNVDERKKLKKNIGIWTHKTDESVIRNFKIFSEGFFSHRKNLEGAIIKVLSPIKDPCKEPSFRIGIFSIVQCIHIKILDLMADMLNAKTELVVDPGLNLDTILTTEAELTIRSAPMNSYDMNTRSFLWPIFRDKLQIYAKLIDTDVEWRTFLKPFDGYMWAAIFFWMILCELIIIAVEFIVVKDEKVGPLLNYYGKYSFLSIFSVCNQAGSGTPISFTHRIIHFLIFAVPFFLIPGYSAVLTSFLTVESPKMPFRNLQELAKSTDYRLGWHKFLPNRNIFSESKDKSKNSTLHDLFRGIFLPDDEMINSDEVALHRMCTEKFAYVAVYHSILALKPKCKIFSPTEYLNIIFTTIELKKNSMYLHFLDECVRVLQTSGLLLKPKMSVVMKFLSYEKERETFDKISPIGLSNIILPFVVLLAGLMLSLITLTLEILSKNNFNKK